MTTKNTPNLPIYLDHHATTPTDPRVMEKMIPWFSDYFGNAHSVQHGHGRAAEEAVETARQQVADLIGAQTREIIFTSGATEANNMSIKGVVRHHLRHFGKAHVVTFTSEHKCVLESCVEMERDGARVTVLPVQQDGLIDLDAFEAALEPDTVLVSVMAANNEIGVIQPMAEIGALCRGRKIVLHTDAAQAAGKIPMDVVEMNIGLMSISGHKMYGPKGIGILYVRRTPRVRIEPLLSGGGQERGLRAGTLPVPLCVGIGEACAIAQLDMERDSIRLGRLRDRLADLLRAGIPDLVVNGSMEQRLSNNLNVSVPNVNGLELIAAMSDLSVSSGSACNSAEVEPSYVLSALGLSPELAGAALRFGLGRINTEAEIDYAAAFVTDAVARLRRHDRERNSAAVG